MAFDETGGLFYGTKARSVLQADYVAFGTFSSSVTSVSDFRVATLTGVSVSAVTVTSAVFGGATTVSGRPFMFVALANVQSLISAGQSTNMGFLDGSKYPGFTVRTPWYINTAANSTNVCGTYTVNLTLAGTVTTLSSFNTTARLRNQLTLIPREYDTEALVAPNVCVRAPLASGVYTVSLNRIGASAPDPNTLLMIGFMLEPPFGYTGAVV